MLGPSLTASFFSLQATPLMVPLILSLCAWIMDAIYILLRLDALRRQDIAEMRDVGVVQLQNRVICYAHSAPILPLPAIYEWVEWRQACAQH